MTLLQFLRLNVVFCLQGALAAADPRIAAMIEHSAVAGKWRCRCCNTFFASVFVAIRHVQKKVLNEASLSKKPKLMPEISASTSP